MLRPPPQDPRAARLPVPRGPRDWCALARATVYTGPVDEYFGRRLGPLPYRSLRFDFVPYPTEYRQPCVQINYPNDFAYTRSVEVKHVTGQRHPETVVSYETPAAAGEPYYPTPTPAKLPPSTARYKRLADEETTRRRVHFCGRLAQYRYFNTDEVISGGAALLSGDPPALRGRFRAGGPRKPEHAAMIQLDYLVTGTGRCGTVNLAMTLTSVGVPCSHERFFDGNSLEEAVALLMAHGGRNSHCSTANAGLPTEGRDVKACASYMAAPFLADPLFRDTTVIHVVRHPVKVLLSFLNDIGFFWYADPDNAHEAFIHQHLKGIREIGDPVDRAAFYYVGWNAMIRENCRGRKAVFHRIEDGPDVLLEKLGLPRRAAAGCYRNEACNTWPDKKVRCTVEDIYESKYSEKLFALGAEFDYGA